MKSIPIIDFRFEQDCVEEMYKAYTTCGFAIFTHAYDNWLSEFEDWKVLMEEFFQLPLDVKQQYRYSGVKENIGENCKTTSGVCDIHFFYAVILKSPIDYGNRTY